MSKFFRYFSEIRGPTEEREVGMKEGEISKERRKVELPFKKLIFGTSNLTQSTLAIDLVSGKRRKVSDKMRQVKSYTRGTKNRLVTVIINNNIPTHDLVLYLRGFSTWCESTEAAHRRGGPAGDDWTCCAVAQTNSPR